MLTKGTKGSKGKMDPTVCCLPSNSDPNQAVSNPSQVAVCSGNVVCVRDCQALGENLAAVPASRRKLSLLHGTNN